MTTREPVDINPDDLLPPWVARRATGSYAEVGAILPTRDGSKISNATVAASEYHTGGERWAIRIVTDAGTGSRSPGGKRPSSSTRRCTSATDSEILCNVLAWGAYTP